MHTWVCWRAQDQDEGDEEENKGDETVVVDDDTHTLTNTSTARWAVDSNVCSFVNACTSARSLACTQTDMHANWLACMLAR